MQDSNEKREYRTYNYNEVFSKNKKYAAGDPLYDNCAKVKPFYLKTPMIILWIVLALLFMAFIVGNLWESESSHRGIFTGDYIGIISIEGEISDDKSSGFDKDKIIDEINNLKNDSDNKGLILKINTPGGSVYATAEIYKALKDYKREKPVYVYMEEVAASGGYYLSMASNKIYANENCLTGSIGVVMGNVIDVTGLLDKMGVKVTTFASGPNKTMGSMTKPITDEQKAIYQSIIDEAYGTFVNVVAEGRNMSVDQVKAIADGRVYTAKQALDKKLIDGIGSFEDCKMDMLYAISTNTYEDIKFLDIDVSAPSSIFSDFFGRAGKSLIGSKIQYDEITKLMNENNKLRLKYISNVQP